MAISFQSALLFLFCLWTILPTLLEYRFKKKYKVRDSGAVVITGTSSGIGRAACGYLASQLPEFKFYCGLRKMPTPEENDQFPYPFSLPNVEPIILDITKEDQVRAAAATVRGADLPLVGLINNAGVTMQKTVEFTSMEDFKRIFEVNLFGTVRLTQTLLPFLRESQGRIINIGSITGVTPGLATTSAYQGSKYALEALTDSLRRELADHGVSVSLLQPGILESELTRKLGEEMLKCATTEESKVYPTSFSEEFAWLSVELMNRPGNINETLKAFHHALVSDYPQTRYKTSRMGVFSASQIEAMCRYLPDRVNDISAQQLKLMVALQRMQSYIEGIML